MKAKHIARGLLVAVGVLVAGCGGAEVAEESSPALTTREDQIICSDDHTMYNRWIYYSDDTYTVAVGEKSCMCVDVVNWGITTAFYQNLSGYCE